MIEPIFRRELIALLNKHRPNMILGKFIMDCISAFEAGEIEIIEEAAIEQKGESDGNIKHN